MRKLLRLLLKYYAVFLFLILEGTAIALIVSQNHYHNAVFINASTGILGYTSEKWSNLTHYFSLKKENEKLIKENLKLHRKLEEINYKDNEYVPEYITAKVVNASVFKQKNYITINIGEKHGVKKQMAVMGHTGVIGLVENTSPHYATVIPIINTRFHLSVKIKRNGYFGSLSWDGQSYQYAQLNDIPAYVDVNTGDTILTSGLSTSFPDNKLVGTVSKAKKTKNTAFWDIQIQLGTDFKQLTSVYIIKLPLSEEQKKLENSND
ncbi:MAG: rod shape-determining protein MreC [Candidatus Delongbacteria bacterium]|jgi:rod shape-determining protein MreC|nr:rod shape-determining protein MreC [Candidatus Delongbacteria bacterium]